MKSRPSPSPNISRYGRSEAARAGSHEAFGELVTLHERMVFRVALAALGNREDALDAAQDAFVVAWRRLGGFRGDAAFRTWLLTIERCSAKMLSNCTTEAYCFVDSTRVLKYACFSSSRLALTPHSVASFAVRSN